MTFVDGFQPKSYIIPATAWGSPNALLKDYEYIGKKSEIGRASWWATV